MKRCYAAAAVLAGCLTVTSGAAASSATQLPPAPDTAARAVTDGDPFVIVPPIAIDPSLLLRYSCEGQAATIVGTVGDDVLHGTWGPDVIVGLGGNDVIDGLSGNDRICAGGGNDIVYAHDTTLGGAGFTDRVFGGPGDDYLFGGAGHDGLFGQDGLDRIYAMRGNDTMQGGAGDDVLMGLEGVDYHEGGPGDDLLNAAYGDDGSYDMVYGGEGNDRLLTNDGVGNDVGAALGGYDGCAGDAGDDVSGCHFTF